MALRRPPTALTDDGVATDPIEQFLAWFHAATEADIPLAEAMTLATATKSGAPSARILLLKGVDQDGFVFFTNYESRKARELAENPQAALVFYWRELGRQVRVEGTVSRIRAAESKAYFATRPRASRLSAWASRQSDVIPSREVLEARVAALAARYADGDVPLPPFWRGYRLSPDSVEFWQHRDDRLHDRLRYRRDAAGHWSRERLAP